jgi:hypothetical protein
MVDGSRKFYAEGAGHDGELFQKNSDPRSTPNPL